MGDMFTIVRIREQLASYVDPGLAISFYGPNRIIANAIDDNLYDFVRSQSIQQGGSTFSPGEIPNPLERIVGAHGVFGSYARISHEFFVLRAESLAVRLRSRRR